MADKSTQLLIDALSRAAADPAGVPLYGSKSDPGLFASTATSKPVAQKALDDGFLTIVRTETKGKAIRELCAATEKGLRFLLEQVSPKQVLEDFVRVLEARDAQVTELLDAANRMAETLAGLKAAVAVVLPQVQASRIPSCSPPRIGEGLLRTEDSPLPSQPLPPTPSPKRGGGAGAGELSFSPPRFGEGPGEGLPRISEGTPFSVQPLPPTPSPKRRGGEEPTMTGVATLEAATETDDLAGAILTRLADWSASAIAGQDCPLPELYRSLTTREIPPTIGVFHDCLRQLHDEHRIYLHPWTGPLYALPEPAYALLVGHNVAFYASARS